MGYYISSMIGIRTHAADFPDGISMDEIKARIVKVAERIRIEEPDYDDDDQNFLNCISDELTGWKGSMVVIGGTFNYWTFENVAKFAWRLSEEFQTYVMVMTWDEERDIVNQEVFIKGKRLCDAIDR